MKTDEQQITQRVSFVWRCYIRVRVALQMIFVFVFNLCLAFFKTIFTESLHMRQPQVFRSTAAYISIKGQETHGQSWSRHSATHLGEQRWASLLKCCPWRSWCRSLSLMPRYYCPLVKNYRIVSCNISSLAIPFSCNVVHLGVTHQFHF